MYKYLIVILVCGILGYIILSDMPRVAGTAAGGALGALGIGYYLFRTDGLTLSAAK